MIRHSLIHENGVFFGLPEEEYHSALALSATGIKWLRVSPLDWWARSPLNPQPFEDESTVAQEAGTAYHKRILEGRDAFLAAYAPALDPNEHPDAIDTNEQLYAAIVSRGGSTKKSARKDELIADLLRYWPDAPIWRNMQQLHARQHQGKTLLSAELMARIEVAAAMIERHPQLSLAFTGGYAELSCFWRDAETGVPCKARMDYVKPQAICDLKTFSNPYGMLFDTAVMRSIANYRLHIQAAFYLDAMRHFEPNVERTWLWIFQAQGPAPVARGYVLPAGTIMDIGRQEISEAKAKWLQAWNTYGADPWVDVTDIREIDSTELPAYIAQ